MPATHRPPGRNNEPSGAGTAAAGLGIALLMIACCALPVLIAGGVLAGIGGALGNPWLIAAVVVLVAAGITAIVRRRRSGRDACCPPTEADNHRTDRDHQRDVADEEGPRF
ncbi:hypothetical protein [Streptomyces sp. TBY4]|uniref:hypothetical protein n=1 Tax=Streptomyces sp. TBY4 TaxID=2962030 RepID=UPI0020B7C12C|nr:hypothetical protein [Streptomyces sp. TBY4]MCP3757049.1 hypothetical protein [Streptomyces sp. TBY4]